MYWVYLVIFILAVLTPDIIGGDFYFLPEKRAEELFIFFLGLIGFLFFAWMEHELFLRKKEKRRDAKKIDQTIKDLVESYSYIGEVNRKMDILMNISLGLTERSNLSKNKQTEIYKSILEAAKFLMKAECACIWFINTESGILVKEKKTGTGSVKIKPEELLALGDDVFSEKIGNSMITSSHQEIRKIRCFIIIDDYDEQDRKTVELLRVMASQALFVYSYAGSIAD